MFCLVVEQSRHQMIKTEAAKVYVKVIYNFLIKAATLVVMEDF